MAKRAHHVDAQVVLFRHAPERADFIRRIDGAQFRRLGEADDAGLGVMDVGAFLDHAFDARRIDLAVLAGDLQDLGAVGKELRRPAFVGLHMGQFVAEDAVIGLAHGGEREGVGRRAVEDEEDFAVGLEDFADEVRRAGRPRIVAVADGVVVIGFRERSPGLGADAGVIITGEMAARRLHRAPSLDRSGARIQPELQGNERHEGMDGWPSRSRPW